MDLFGEPMIRERLRPLLAEAAAHGVRVGTSSWKYPGWLGMLYDEQCYLTGKRFSSAKFERDCLAEYAQTFSTVCFDGAFYAFPTGRLLEGIISQVPSHFRFGFKVTDAITTVRHPRIARMGSKAGQPNEHFLNADLFASAFLAPLEQFRENVGPIIFEFGHLSKSDFARGRDFVDALGRFLSAVPAGWQYSVEMRNAEWLVPEYFEMLRERGVAHCYNAWTKMPAVAEQMALPGSRTADFFAARFLLSPGRAYEAAVEAFSPYRETKAPDPGARRSIAELVKQRGGPGRDSYVYVNNRLEGQALETIFHALAILTAGR